MIILKRFVFNSFTLNALVCYWHPNNKILKITNYSTLKEWLEILFK